MKKLFAKLIVLSGIILSLAACNNGGGGESGSSQGGNSSSTPQTSSQVTPEDEPELPEGTDITVYLVLTKIGKYEGQAGDDVPEYFLENAIKLETKVGADLPGADKVTSTSGATFQGWMKYDGNGAPTKYTKAPNKNHQILYANFSGGSGGSGGGGGGSDTDKPTSGMAIVVNGNKYYSLTNEGPWDMDPTYTQYSYTAGLTLAANDVLSFYDADNDASWGTMAIDPASKGGLTQTASGIKVGTAGTYDIYIKMKSGQDNIYLGEHA